MTVFLSLVLTQKAKRVHQKGAKPPTGERLTVCVRVGLLGCPLLPASRSSLEDPTKGLLTLCSQLSPKTGTHARPLLSSSPESPGSPVSPKAQPEVTSVLRSAGLAATCHRARDTLGTRHSAGGWLLLPPCPTPGDAPAATKEAALVLSEENSPDDVRFS